MLSTSRADLFNLIVFFIREMFRLLMLSSESLIPFSVLYLIQEVLIGLIQEVVFKEDVTCLIVFLVLEDKALIELSDVRIVSFEFGLSIKGQSFLGIETVLYQLCAL
jgi:hypothetical protein